jgi:hypothetical protein
MGTKTYLQVTGTIFSIIGLLHLGRLVWGWQANIGLFQVPMWLSWLALIIAAWLAYSAFTLAGKK